MVSWPYDHCNVDQCICYRGSPEMSQIWVRGSHFSEVNGYCWFWWCFNRKIWLVDHIIIVMLIIVSAMGGLQKCPKFDLCNFCILCTCPKSCFGGLNEQSGYLDDGFNTKVCSVDNIIIAVYINGVGHMGSSEMCQIWVQWSPFLTVIGYSWFGWFFNRKVW